MRPKRLVTSACIVGCSLIGVPMAWAQMPPPADTPEPGPPPPIAPEPAPPPATPPAPPPAVQARADAAAPLGKAIGVGVHAMLTGPYGPSIVYNGGAFHIEGILAFADVNDATTIGLGGRAWFHVHESASASLSVGGGLGFASIDVEDPLRPGMSVTNTNILLEGGAQIRFFATRNVALSASLGLGIVAGDGDAISLLGQLTGGVGLTYFIF